MKHYKKPAIAILLTSLFLVTGCAAQTQPQMFADMIEVDRVIGNDDKMRGDSC